MAVLPPIPDSAADVAASEVDEGLSTDLNLHREPDNVTFADTMLEDPLQPSPTTTSPVYHLQNLNSNSTAQLGVDAVKSSHTDDRLESPTTTSPVHHLQIPNSNAQLDVDASKSLNSSADTTLEDPLQTSPTTSPVHQLQILNSNSNAQLDVHATKSSSTARKKRHSANSGTKRQTPKSTNRGSVKSSIDNAQSDDELLETPLPPPPCIPPLCEGMPLELFLLDRQMEEEKERARQEEEERYALLHPKV